MTVYFIEQLPDEKITVYTCKMNQRHKIWVAHPNAREISRKEYELLKNMQLQQSIEPVSQT
jgi:hypothetical protein